MYYKILIIIIIYNSASATIVLTEKLDTFNYSGKLIFCYYCYYLVIVSDIGIKYSLGKNLFDIFKRNISYIFENMNRIKLLMLIF